ncbi:MAG: IS3 family transposase [Eubacteriales bacterium]|nr:IS3 family transposase [Eubacteriales bacterium]
MPDEDDIRAKVIALAAGYGRVGYRMVTAMMNNDGIAINHKRVERIWREEGLQLPKKQTKKKRIWLNDCGSIGIADMLHQHQGSRKPRKSRLAAFYILMGKVGTECFAVVGHKSGHKETGGID